MRIQMLGQMALIQNLARGQEELRALVTKLLQDEMKRTVKIGDRVTNQPLIKQEVGLVERTPFKMATTPRIQQLPRQARQGGPHKQDTHKRHFTEINMSLTQALHYMLEVELVSLREPPQKPNTSSPRYKHNEKCVYHSNSQGHDTNHCWALKNKIQYLIDEIVLEFTQDGQLEFFCHLSKTHRLKQEV